MMRTLCAILEKLLCRQQRIVENQIITMEGIEDVSQASSPWNFSYKRFQRLFGTSAAADNAETPWPGWP